MLILLQESENRYDRMMLQTTTIVKKRAQTNTIEYEPSEERENRHNKCSSERNFQS